MTSSWPWALLMLLLQLLDWSLFILTSATEASKMATCVKVKKRKSMKRKKIACSDPVIGNKSRASKEATGITGNRMKQRRAGKSGLLL